MSQRNLPLLEVGIAYLAQDFESFEFSRLFQGEGKATLRLHLKNKTTLDLPTTDADLQRLAVVLAEAYPAHVIAHLKSNSKI